MVFSGGNMETSTGEFTRLLKDCGAGNRQALDKLLPLVYEEVRRLAHSLLNRERSDHTLCLTTPRPVLREADHDGDLDV